MSSEPQDKVSAIKRLPRALVALGFGQFGIGFLTLRDINRRSDDEIRGPRLLWALWGATNTLGSFMYWKIGRRKVKRS